MPGIATFHEVKRNGGPIVLFRYSCNLEQGRCDICVGCDYIKGATWSNARPAGKERNVYIGVYDFSQSKQVRLLLFRSLNGRLTITALFSGVHAVLGDVIAIVRCVKYVCVVQLTGSIQLSDQLGEHLIHSL